MRIEAAALSIAFFNESQKIYEQETQLNTLTAAAALQLLSMTATTYGKEETALKFLREGVNLGKRMGLFDVRLERESALLWLDDHEDWKRAASYTAWGIFNWVAFVSPLTLNRERQRGSQGC